MKSTFHFLIIKGAIFTLLLFLAIFSLTTFVNSDSISSSIETVESITGSHVFPEQRVSIPRDPPAHRYRPQVAFNYIQNEYLVVWHNTTDSGLRYPYARRLDINGKPIGEPFMLSNIVTNQVHPFVVYNGTEEE